MPKDESVCSGATPASYSERTAACERLGLFGLELESPGLAGPTPKRVLKVPKRGCRRASFNGKKWAVAKTTERAGTEVSLAPGEVLVCGTRMKLPALTRFLSSPILAVGALGKLGADVQTVTVEVVIGTDGIARIKINGIKGPACTDLAKQIKAATGLDVLSDSPTAEYYEEPVSIAPTATARRYSL